MFVVFDLETTGLFEFSNDIIQFSYIMFDDNNSFVKSESLYFYYEGMSWSEEAYKIHGISLETLKAHKDEFKANLIKMYSILKGNNVCGYNSDRFDCPFAVTWLSRMGLSGLFFNVRCDVMKAFRPVYHKSQIKLTKLCDLLEIKPEFITAFEQMWFPNDETTQAHNASYDTVATAILALDGIRRKLIMFDTPVHIAIDDPNLEEDMMLSTDTTTVVMDPAYFCVDLKYFESNDSVVYAINHDKHKYTTLTPDLIPTYDSKVVHLPIVLTETADNSNVFQATINGVTYELTMDEDGDNFVLKTPFGVMDDSTFDIKKVISNF